MRRAGIQGISGRPKFRRVPGVATAADRVERNFRRDNPDELWITDVTASRRTYGVRRVHAELTLGQGVTVGHQAVELLSSGSSSSGSGRSPFCLRTPRRRAGE